MTSLGAFFLLPIITKSLGAYDYGLWAQILITVSLISPLALFGMSMVEVRYLSSQTEAREIREGFFSILIFVTCTGILASILVFLCADSIASTFFQDSNAAEYIRMASGLILLNVINQITLFYFRIYHQIIKFSLILIFQSLGRLVLIYALLIAGLGLAGVIIASLIIQGIAALSCIILIVKQIGFTFPKFIHLRDYIHYGAPLTPNSLIRWITDSSDRYLVGYFINLQAVGIYSASYTIGGLIQMFIGPLQLILLPELTRLYETDNLELLEEYLSHSLKYFLFLTIPAAFGLSILAKPILAILTTPEFISGSIVIPFLAFSYLFAGAYQIIINITLIVKKTKINLITHIVAASANVILNIILIPIIGILGAAIATLASYMLMTVISVYISFQHITFNLNGKFITKSIAASSVMAAVLYFIHPVEITDLILTMIGGALIYFTVMVVFKGLSYDEIVMIRKLIKK